MANNDEDRTNWTIVLTTILFIVLIVFVVFQCRGATMVDLCIVSDSPVDYVYTKVKNTSEYWDKFIEIDNSKLDIWNTVWLMPKLYIESNIEYNFDTLYNRNSLCAGSYKRINNNWQIDYEAGALWTTVNSYSNIYFDIIFKNKFLFDIWIFKVQNFTTVNVPIGTTPIFSNELAFITGIGKIANIQLNMRQIFDKGKFYSPVRMGVYIEL